MATTTLSKTGLQKQDKGDKDWQTALNTGFDNLESRIGKTNAGVPNGSVSAEWVGQTCKDTSNGHLYIATTTGSNGWVRLNLDSVCVTPEMLGAIGDGKKDGSGADDTAAVQAAFDSDVPVLLIGSYRVTSTLTVPQGTYIAQARQLSTVQLVIDHNAGPGVQILGRNCTLDGLRIVPSNARKVQNRADNGDHGVLVGQDADVRTLRTTIRNCTIVDQPSDGVHVARPSLGMVIEQNSISRNRRNNVYYDAGEESGFDTSSLPRAGGIAIRHNLLRDGGAHNIALTRTGGSAFRIEIENNDCGGFGWNRSNTSWTTPDCNLYLRAQQCYLKANATSDERWDDSTLFDGTARDSKSSPGDNVVFGDVASGTVLEHRFFTCTNAVNIQSSAGESVWVLNPYFGSGTPGVDTAFKVGADQRDVWLHMPEKHVGDVNTIVDTDSDVTLYRNNRWQKVLADDPDNIVFDQEGIATVNDFTFTLRILAGTVVLTGTHNGNQQDVSQIWLNPGDTVTPPEGAKINIINRTGFNVGFLNDNVNLRCRGNTDTTIANDETISFVIYDNKAWEVSG